MITVETVNVDCYHCGVAYSIPSALERCARNNGREIHCPSCGKSWMYSKTVEKKLEEAKLEIQRKDNQLAMERQKVERMEKRIQRGVCIYCKRTFPNIAKHMTCKHQKEARAH